MARTATEYSAIIQKKEADMERLNADLVKLRSEGDRSQRELIELHGHLETLTAELDAEKADRERGASVRAKLQEELDELRALLAAKTTEETRRTEVEKSKDAELADLRLQTSRLQQDLAESRSSAVEGQAKLKVELDTALRDHKMLQQSHQSLSDRERDVSARLQAAESALSDAEKSKRAAESDLQAVRSRQIDTDDQLAVALRAKEVRGILLSRALANIHFVE
jgi:myosin heavy chain 9/10/11/14